MVYLYVLIGDLMIEKLRFGFFIERKYLIGEIGQDIAEDNNSDYMTFVTDHNYSTDFVDKDYQAYTQIDVDKDHNYHHINKMYFAQDQEDNCYIDFVQDSYKIVIVLLVVVLLKKIAAAVVVKWVFFVKLFEALLLFNFLTIYCNNLVIMTHSEDRTFSSN